MAYIYQADIYCDDCGEEIKIHRKSEIMSERKLSEPEEFSDIFDDERNYDSDEYPKYADDDEESDSPQHCACHENCINAEILPSGRKIGCLISTNLTRDGVEYLKEQIKQSPGEVAEFWKEQFSDYLPRQSDDDEGD